MAGRAALSFLLSFVAGTINVVDIGKGNEIIIAQTEVMLVNFYADWCRFSRQLHPIFVNTANVLREAYPDEKKVALGRVDCEAETEIAQKYHISKYPTIKVFRNGRPMKKEYRGNRSPADFKQFIDELLRDPVIRFDSLEQAVESESKRTKGMLIGYFESEESESYLIFARVAKALQDDCQVLAGFGDASAKERVTGDNIVFKDKPNGNAPLSEAVFLGAMNNYDVMYEWAHDKCVPLVREITFQNGEELTEEGLPFLILFHKMEDTDSLKTFSDEISRTLISERGSVNFLHANCDQFTHPLHHMGKSASDCPVIAIDSFKHMYLFPDYSKAFKKKYLLKFVQDLHSGKLHREFHHGADPTEEPEEEEEEEEEPAKEPEILTGEQIPRISFGDAKPEVQETEDQKEGAGATNTDPSEAGGEEGSDPPPVTAVTPEAPVPSIRADALVELELPNGVKIKTISNENNKHLEIKPTAGVRAKVTPAPVAQEKESIFKKLKPSKHRYTVLEPPRDEL